MHDKFTKETTLSTFLVNHNVKVMSKLWRDMIAQEGDCVLTPYLKGVLTRLVKNAEAMEAPFKFIEVPLDERTAFIRKIADYYKDCAGEFRYLYRKGFIKALASTFPDPLFVDSFVSLVVANYYLTRRCELTLERNGVIDAYNRFQCAYEQWLKFYKEDDIIYSEQDIEEIIAYRKKEGGKL